MFEKWGTGAAYESSVLSGDASIKNWSGSYLDLHEEKIPDLTSEAMDKLYRVKKFACFGCPVGCGAVYHLKAEGYDIEDTGRSEYETSGGRSSKDKINAMRRRVYEENSEEINEQKRDNYEKRIERESSAAEELDVT